jgi:glycosyltransferase involved in cell wall biosynthesis
MVKTLLVLVPAYNAGLTISELIEKISKFVDKRDVVVIDDGSEDQTFEIAQRAGARVLKHERNKGKGEALKTGFEYAQGKNYNSVITIDADLQHDPESIPDFIRKADSACAFSCHTNLPPHPIPLPRGERGNVTDPDTSDRAGTSFSGIIMGTRKRTLRIMPFARWLTNNLSSVIVSVLSGQSIRDSQSGYRLISTDVLKNVKLESKKYDLEPEILIKTSRKGFRIDEVPISTIYTGGKSFINPLVDTGRFIKLMWMSLWW